MSQMCVNSTRTRIRIYSRKHVGVFRCWVLCENSEQVRHQVHLYSVPATNLLLLRHGVTKDPLAISGVVSGIGVAVSRASLATTPSKARKYSQARTNGRIYE